MTENLTHQRRQSTEAQIWCDIIEVDWLMSAVTVEDSGNYTCEIRGPQSNMLHNVTHYVYVTSKLSHVMSTSLMVCSFMCNEIK